MPKSLPSVHLITWAFYQLPLSQEEGSVSMSTALVLHPALLFISETEMISVIVVTVGTTEANTCQSLASLPGWNFPSPTPTGLNQDVGHTAE